MEPSIQRVSSRVPAHDRDARVVRERRSKQQGSQSFEFDEERFRSREPEAPAPRPVTAEPSIGAREDGLGGALDVIA